MKKYGVKSPKMNELVSVIVPIYNVLEYLEKCISSICCQSYPYLQIILVDDGSTDGSSEICDVYKAKDHRVQVIHKQNGGLVSARKAGLKAARGNYICYVDGDDWIEPDMIGNLYAGMRQTTVGLVISNHFCDANDHNWKVEGKYKSGIYNTEDLIPTMLYTGVFYEFGIGQFVWAKLFRKDILWDIQMQVDDRITCGEDVAVTYPYILHVQKVCFLEYAGYHYLQRMGSMTGCYDADEQIKNRILLEYLQQVFRHSIYVHSLHRQLNQYAKNLLLARQIDYFDRQGEDQVLMPFGGISKEDRVIIYGAGKLGQSIYHYLKDRTVVKIVDWVDRNYSIYQRMHMEVHAPERLEELEECTYDYIIIGINNQKAVREIENYLTNISIDREKIRWLDMDFIKEDYFILNRS